MIYAKSGLTLSIGKFPIWLLQVLNY